MKSIGTTVKNVSAGGVVHSRAHTLNISLVLRLFCFILFRFVFAFLLSFTEAAALRSIVLRHACALAVTRVHLINVCVLFYFCLFRDMSLFPACLYHYRFVFV